MTEQNRKYVTKEIGKLLSEIWRIKGLAEQEYGPSHPITKKLNGMHADAQLLLQEKSEAISDRCDRGCHLRTMDLPPGPHLASAWPDPGWLAMLAEFLSCDPEHERTHVPASPSESSLDAPIAFSGDVFHPPHSPPDSYASRS
jgi:hypothetical protein